MMPRHGSKEPQFLLTDAGDLLGVSLSSDFTSEHEHGIGPLRLAFGAFEATDFAGRSISPYKEWKDEREDRGFFSRLIFGEDPPLPPMGVERRRVRVVPEGFSWVKASSGEEGFGHYGRSYTNEKGYPQREADRAAEHQKGPYGQDDLIGAWSDEAFIVLARSDNSKLQLRCLFEAVLAGNAMISLALKDTSGDLIGNGLCIWILDKLPKAIAEKLLAGDTDDFLREKEFDETGVEAELRAAGKRWFFLGDYKKHGDENPRAWLNPMDQDIHSSGWFTVEELRLWAKNEGPVMGGRIAERARHEAQQAAERSAKRAKSKAKRKKSPIAARTGRA